MNLGEAIRTYDPAVALRDETGCFQVTTPSGDELFITCKPGHSIVSLQWGVEGQPFLVTKISEPVTNTEVNTPPVIQGGRSLKTATG